MLDAQKPSELMKPAKNAEWPTLCVAVLCYLGFLIGVVGFSTIGPVCTVVILTLSIALHSSLQHEALHGHPFRSAILNELLVFLPIGLFVPYQRFRDLHLAHHFDPNLTDPYDDPESNYVDPMQWAVLPTPVQLVLRFNNTLCGRMLIGPLIGLRAFYVDDGRALLRADRLIWRAYSLHFVGLMIVFVCVVQFMPLANYILASYLAMSLLKLRTFLEHRAHETVPGRTVIIEDQGIFAFLFLNNNFHSVHHAHPKVAWYKLPALYQQRRSEFLHRNRSYLYASYWSIILQHFLTAKDPVPHPLMKDQSANAAPAPSQQQHATS